MTHDNPTPAINDSTDVARAPHRAGGHSPNCHALPALTEPAIDCSPLLVKTRKFQNARKVRALGLYPYFRTISSAQDTEVIMNGRRILMLGSNSYLGLTNHPKIKEAVKSAVDRYGSG